jgi:hypothetical protein
MIRDTDPGAETLLRSSRWRVLYPAVGLIVVILIGVVLSATVWSGLPPQHRFAFAAFLTAQPESPEPAARFFLMGPFVWAATAMVLAALFTAGIIVFAYVFWRVALSRQQSVDGAVLVLATLTLGLIVWVIAPTNDETIQMILERLFGFRWTIERPQFARVTDALLGCNLVLATLACGSLCRSISSTDPAEELTRRKTYLTVILYLGALSLSAAVLQVYWTFRLPGNAIVLGVTPGELDAVAGGLAILAGTYYSLIWAGLYVPTAGVLAFATKEAASRGGATTDAQVRKWLTEHGLAIRGWQQLLRLAALLGPLIAGWVGEPAGRLISSLGLG